jgi:phosphoenolpyruvate carboxylase
VPTPFSFPQKILTKADLTIARLHAHLVDDQSLGTAILGRIAAEYQRTASVFCQITGQDEHRAFRGQLSVERTPEGSQPLAGGRA